jgi:hypothetical protein
VLLRDHRSDVDFHVPTTRAVLISRKHRHNQVLQELSAGLAAKLDACDLPVMPLLRIKRGRWGDIVPGVGTI